MRLVGVSVAALLALAALAAALVPAAIRHREHAALPPMFAGTTSVYAVPFAGGPGREMLRLHGQWAFPVVTADGRAVLLERPAPTGTGVWRVPLDGSRRTLVATKRRFAVQLSRVGPYTAEEKETRPASSGWRLDLTLRRERTVVWTRRMPFPLAAVAAAPDGATAAMVRMRFLEVWSAHGRRLLAADAQQSWAPEWTPDGRSLLYWNDRRELVVVDVRTRVSRVLLHGRYFENALSPDGKTVYVLGMNDAVSIPK